MTRSDKIRAMSDDDLSVYLFDITEDALDFDYCDGCDMTRLSAPHCVSTDRGDCYESMKRNLRQEATK